MYYRYSKQRIKYKILKYMYFCPYKKSLSLGFVYEISFKR